MGKNTQSSPSQSFSAVDGVQMGPERWEETRFRALEGDVSSQTGSHSSSASLTVITDMTASHTPDLTFSKSLNHALAPIVLPPPSSHAAVVLRMGLTALGMSGSAPPPSCTQNLHPSNLPACHSYLFSLFLGCLQCKAGVAPILQRKTMVRGTQGLSQSHRGERSEKHVVPLAWA